MKVRKAVIPAAGFGTRFLPITKSQPKEMIPVVDTPVIQYVVEEAVNSGITDILMIIGRGKRAIEEYFDRSWELERALKEKGKTEMLERLQSITTMANIHFVWQKELLGLGHAISHARAFVGDEPFAVLLGDTLMDGNKEPVTKQLLNQFDKYQKSIVALEKVPIELTYKYGVVDGEEVEKNLFKAKRFVEKPKPEEAPSDLVIASRYVITSEIFNYLDQTKPGLGNEIQLTDAMQTMLNDQDIYGYQFDGIRYDIGNKLDFIKTNLVYGLKNAEIGEELKKWLQKFNQ
ncbi:MAG TPA: UTP--glucose-1-phosphate uridylyltransferase GalU [Prolixibacteraceae bacterium]|nr:UTP--glucose-1-phosphate uridylyltransferase GalU [Prolixibacteraceae bacterium]